ncbi:MAG: alpha/beta family hydrolase [Bryobacteraceae bacterium]
MARRIESLSLAGPAGSLEGMLEEPDGHPPRLAAVVCHPHPLYGGTMHNKVVYRIARGLRRAGCVVLRFNFRGVGQSAGEHGYMAGEIEDARAALEYLRGRYPELPFALAGFSFGSRAIMQLGCEMCCEMGCELGGAQFLLAAGFATRMGPVEFLAECAVPKIFIHSTHDEFGPRPDFERMYLQVAEPKRLIWIEAADHFFAGALEELEERVMEAASGAPMAVV